MKHPLGNVSGGGKAVLLLGGWMMQCVSAVGAPTPVSVIPSQFQARQAVTRAFLQDIYAQSVTADRHRSLAITGKQGWMFYPYELRSQSVGPFWGSRAAQVSRFSTPGLSDPLSAILSAKKQLERAGIELLVVPVPAKAVIYPEMISSTLSAERKQSLPRFDIYDKQFYDVLRAHGVSVLDLTPAFLQHRATGEQLYCKQDTHWSSAACALAARLIAAKVRQRFWVSQVPKHTYETYTKMIQSDGGDMRLPGMSAEHLPVTYVQERTSKTRWFRKQESVRPVSPWSESPVLLVGDSFCTAFTGQQSLDIESSPNPEDWKPNHITNGGGLPDHLALQLGFPPDLESVNGSAGFNAMKALARRKDNLARKRLMIWCFAVREFTETNGWQTPILIR